MAKTHSTRRRAGPSPSNPLNPNLLLNIWRQLNKRNREQVLTAAFGMLREQVHFEDGLRLPKALQKVLFRSNARAPFDKVLLCGPAESIGLPRNREIGRWQRSMRWVVNGNLIAPDWRAVRS